MSMAACFTSMSTEPETYVFFRGYEFKPSNSASPVPSDMHVVELCKGDLEDMHGYPNATAARKGQRKAVALWAEAQPRFAETPIFGAMHAVALGAQFFSKGTAAPITNTSKQAFKVQSNLRNFLSVGASEKSAASEKSSAKKSAVLFNQPTAVYQPSTGNFYGKEELTCEDATSAMLAMYEIHGETRARECLMLHTQMLERLSTRALATSVRKAYVPGH